MVTQTVARVLIADRAVRGYWLTDLGQRVEEWVPVGVYTRGNAVEVSGRGLVVALVAQNGWAWHVPASVADANAVT